MRKRSDTNSSKNTLDVELQTAMDYFLLNELQVHRKIV